ncbi:hypothetical protein ONA92_02265 [Mycobacteroides salmoniphilum]|uniref:hypothetical protein n=1 Tax=Mycobacteroides salmoniphilum TaxID=404941 RepID=UPI00356A4DBE
MRFNGDYLYRVQVTSYPDGSHHEVDYGGELFTEPVPGWQPPGWRPVGDYTQIMGTDEFVWPVVNKVYGTRRTAQKRVHLLESYGARAVVERSSRITWPEESAA